MPEISTRSVAREQGLDRYFTGRPCKHGHTSVRYTLSGNCASCSCIRSAAWQRVHKEASAATATKWRQSHPEASREAGAKWRRENLDAIRRSNTRWESQNPVARRALNTKWRRLNHGASCAFSASRRASRLQRTPAWADQARMTIVYKVATQMSTELGIRMSVDHVIPLQGKIVSGLHVPGNLKIITASENSRKHNRFIN
jgi:hypothetical protein